MGKRDKRIAWINPVAVARANATPHSGPTIRDYLNRPRPTWDEVKDKISKGKDGSHSLADWEKQQEQNYKEDLKRHREEIFGKHKKLKKKKKKKKSKYKRREISSSQDSNSDSSDSFDKKKKHKLKRKKPDWTSSSGEDSDDSDLHSKKKKKKKRKGNK